MNRQNVGQLLTERDGYKASYEKLNREVGQLRSERDGYKKAYEQISREVGNLRAAANEQGSAARPTIDRQTTRSLLKMQQQARNAALIGNLNTIASTAGVFGDQECGSSPFSLIVNAVPKAGTYLLLETIKNFNTFKDVGHHVYTEGMRKLRPDGSFEAERHVPALMWASALRRGLMCAAHLEFDAVIEQYLIARADSKMIFIIRDPRDLVVSWVDFVFSSRAYSRMTARNAYEQSEAVATYPNDEDRISASIEGLLMSDVADYIPWINSRACLTVKFEDLYSELSGESEGTLVDTIADYLEVSRPTKQSMLSVLGRGITSSDRASKVGVFRERMTPNHLARIGKPDFRRLIFDFGYR
jgi:hypothetical protein